MYYNLLFNGCSFTFGLDLEGKYNDFEHREKHRFSHLVAEKTGLIYDNISRPGCSNNSILRRTVEWFEAGNTCDHAIIQLTRNFRKSHFVENHNFVEFGGTGRNNQKQFRELYYAYIELQNPSNDQYDEDMCKYWIQNFLQDKCSSFYLKLEKDLKSCDSYYENSIYNKCTSNMKISHIVNGILPKQSEDPDYYCKVDTKLRFEGDISTSIVYGGHPNELGHVRIADYIVNNDDYFKAL